MRSKEKIEEALPPKAVDLFLDITEERVLGASRHIEMVGTIFQIVSACGAGENWELEKTKSLINDVSEYMQETRGKASQAITNALRLITSRFYDFEGTAGSFAELVDS